MTAVDGAGRRAPVSFATRLFIAIGLTLLAGGTALTYAAFLYGQRAAQDTFDRLLIGAASQISTSIQIVDGAAIVDLPVPALELLALAREDRIVYRVVGPDGATLTGYDEPALPGFQGDSYFFDATFTGAPARFAAVKRRFAERGFSGTITTIVGHTTVARGALAWNIIESAWLLLGMAGFAMVALATFAIRSALSPLARIEQDLGSRDPKDLTPLDIAVPAEIRPFVATINRFMARLRRQIEGTENLISDSAHQLRTPIAALRAQAELAEEEEDPERRRAIVRRIHKRSVDLSRLTDQILNRALVIHRADSAIHATIDLRKVAIAATEVFDDSTLFETGRLRLDLPRADVAVRGDALSLREAASNFINNALRHGAGRVTVAVRREGDRACLAVADEGAGLTDAAMRELGARFVATGRGSSGGTSSASAGTSTGTGIGLAIARAVAAAHDGELRAGPGAAGGFEIALLLPLAPEGLRP